MTNLTSRKKSRHCPPVPLFSKHEEIHPYRTHSPGMLRQLLGGQERKPEHTEITSEMSLRSTQVIADQVEGKEA